MAVEPARSSPDASGRGTVARLLRALISAGGRRDPFPVYEQFRALGPVVKVPWEAFIVTSYTLCREILTSKDWLNVGPQWRETHKPDSNRPGTEFVENTVLALNAPEHARLRTGFHDFLSTRMVQDARPMVDDLVQQSLSALDERLTADGTADFTELVSSRLPMAVVCELLGLPRDDAAMLRQMSRDLAYVLDLSPDAHKLRRADDAALLWEAYWRHLRARPRPRLPQDTALAGWLESERTDDLDERRLSAMIGVMVVGGHETTAGLLSDGLVALLEQPEQMAWLRMHPDRTPGAVEELLRFVSPAQMVTRYAARDTVLGDVPVRAGQLAHTVLAAANRDPEIFARPDRLDLSRRAGRNLAMGAGIHYCVGAALARLEAESLFPALLERFPGLALAGAPVYRDNLAYRGASSMPVRIAASSRPTRTSGDPAEPASTAPTREGAANEPIATSVDGAVLTVILNRPCDHNALDMATLSALHHLFSDLADRREIRVVVLAGAGPTFGAGIDVAELKRLAACDPARVGAVAAQADRLCTALRAAPQVTIAQVHGHVVGAGIALAALCDLRIAADTSTFRLPELTLGMPVAWGGVLGRLVAEIGTARLRQMVLLGDRVDAATARSWGLVHETAGEDELRDVTRRWARRLSRQHAAAVTTTKKLLTALEPNHPNIDAEVFTAAILGDRSRRRPSL
ncbi:cytochrome P450 [Spirillospora sp. CA-253888]